MRLNEQEKLALIKLYDELNMDLESWENDWEHDYLTINTTRNGRDVLWYVDDNNEACIYVDTLEFLTDEEIEEELR